MRQVTPRLRPEDKGILARSCLDIGDFQPTYIRRNQSLFPQAAVEGDTNCPWFHSNDYYVEKDVFPTLSLVEDGALIYSNPK